MSAKYCLIIYSNDYRKIGSIASINEELQKEALNPEMLQIHEFSSIMELYYYHDMDKNERVNHFKAGMFDKIKNLSPGKFCLARYKNSTVTCEILNKEIHNNRLTFQCKVEVLNSPIDILATSIIKILTDEPDKTECQRKNLKSSEGDLENERTAETINDGFYILSSEYRIHNAGSIVKVINGRIEIDSYILTLADDLKQKLIKIERDYAYYLLGVSIENRINYHKEGRFKRIKELKVGDVIYFKNERCSVEIIYKTKDGPIFSLKSKSSPYMVHKDVKACEIKFKQSFSDNLHGKRPSIETDSGQNREGKTILCEPINSQVLDPNGKIKRIDTDGAKNVSNKFIIIRHDKGVSVVKLLWKGLIDNLKYLGCELFDKFDKGTDGKFFGKQLFCCQRPFGVLIPTNNNDIDICESGCDIKHKDLEMGFQIINEETICCVEITNDSCEFNDITIGQNISYGGVLAKVGEVLWLGIVNGQKCIGIKRWDRMLRQSYREGGIISIIDIFSCQLYQAGIIKLEDAKKERIQFKIDKIVDTNKISYAKEINKNELKGLKKGDPIKINALGEKWIGELKWFGMINNEECVGLDMEKSFPISMDGAIKIDIKFECLRKHGLLTLLNEVELIERPELHFLEEGIIDPNQYLRCIEKKDFEFFKPKGIKQNDFVFIKIKEKGKEIKKKGKLKWSGLMNEVAVGVVELTENHEKGTDGNFWRNQLFLCINKRAIATTLNNILREPVITFLDDIFVQNDGNVEHLEVLKVCESYEIGDLVLINGKQKYYGYCQFFKTFYDHVVVGIELEEKEINKYPQVNKVLFHQPFFSVGKCGVIVNLKKIEKVAKEVTFIGNSRLIHKSFIKIRQQYLSKHFKKGDIVTPSPENVNENFVVFNSWLINGIPSLEVGKAIRLEENFTTEFLKEGDVHKVDTDTKHKYYGGAIIEPKSLLTFLPDSKGKFKNKDKVKFSLNDMETEYQGCIILSGQANRIPSSLVKIDIESGEKFVNVSINNERSFHLIEKSAFPIVIIPNYILKKTSRNYQVINGIPVLDLQTLKSKEVKAINERIIIFKYNDNRRSAFMKWTGFINKVFCLGCEIGNFSFQSNQELFWIPLEALDECCEKTGHKQLKSDENKFIDARSICCISQEKKEVTDLGRTINVGDRVKIKMGIEKGLCKWKGFVNKVQVIGLELTSQVNNGTSGNFCDYHLFQSKSNCGILCEASELEYALPLQTVPNFEFKIFDPFSIKSIENGKGCDLKLFLKSEKWINVQWKGCVNDCFCIGCKLPIDIENGTNGTFNGSKLFHCPDKKGVLVPVDELKDCCKTSEHKDIVRIKDGYISPNYLSINPDCICCIEQENEIKRWPKLRKGSNVTFSKRKKEKIDGICKWIGSINGIESVGVEMEHKLPGGTNGRFKNVNLFRCVQEKGYLFLAEDIFHDSGREKLWFNEDKIVDTTKIFYSKNIKKNEFKGLKKGDPIKIKILGETWIGELKWFGMINNEECVGLDMEISSPLGMDGIIKDNLKFECLRNHGLVTLFSEIKLIERPELRFLEEGIIDPNQYLKIEEKGGFEFLIARGLKRIDLIFIKIYEKSKEIKRKGKLKWSGLMNEVPVCVVELSEIHRNGTDGTFWRRRLFRCKDKCAIAIKWNNIFEYQPYQQCDIPKEKQIFENIFVNSAVKYLYLSGNDVKEVYGTVRWTGRNEDEEYFYGIELDDKISEGSDGTFNEQKLFNCSMGCGILAHLNKTFPDIRSLEIEISPEEIPKSEDSTKVCLAIFSKLYEGLNRGIQGSMNSSYFNSVIFALFAKSDVLYFMISLLNNLTERDENTKNFRRIISRKIIYPLREFGWVSFHKTAEMRDVIQNYGKEFAEMAMQESKMENVSTVLSKLCPNEQLLSIVSHDGHKSSSMFINLFANLKIKSKYLTSEEMLKISMAQNEIMFNEIPSCLIMQTHRDKEGFGYFDSALPLEIIEISDICSNYFRKCHNCEKEAVWQCKACMKNENINILTSFRCDTHKCCDEEKKKLTRGEIKSRSKVFLELKAMICIENSHFVSFVKQEEIVNDKSVKQWFLFDSMGPKSFSYHCPKVSLAKFETEFLLNSSKNDMIKYIDEHGIDQIKKIVKDACVFIYENPIKNCY